MTTGSSSSCSRPSSRPIRRRSPTARCCPAWISTASASPSAGGIPDTRAGRRATLSAAGLFLTPIAAAGCGLPLRQVPPHTGTSMAKDAPKNAPRGASPFKGPTVVRYRDAARFLWGDAKSGEVADVVYGRNEVIGTLVFKLKPGGYFRSSDTWKSFFDQHRFYYVLKGEIAVQDPATGESAVAKAGQAGHWRRAKGHFGYNFRSEECAVLDWYAPQERPPHVTELEFGSTKPQFREEKPGQSEFLGRWPDALVAARAQAESKGGMITAL